jgi:lysophospholipid acyltransferase (LPLAT)-like uncharacterized protein
MQRARTEVLGPAAGPRGRLGAALLALAVLGLGLLLRLLRLTWRVGVEGSPGVGRGARLYALWHGDLVALSGAPVAPRPTMLISRSRDGDWAARAARSLGYGVERGSSSRGGVAGALAVVRRLRRGRPVALAADGPRGPRHVAGPSGQRLGRLAGARLVAVAAAAPGGGWQLSTWDRMWIPRPFSRLQVVWRPLQPGEDLQQALDRARARARELLGAKS